jgi:hypothetical protein
VISWRRFRLLFQFIDRYNAYEDQHGDTTMNQQSDVHQLLEKATAILPLSSDDLIYKGIAVGLSDRLIDLKKTQLRLQEKYHSLDELERRIQTEGVSPDDHTLYTDLLEWRAIQYELSELARLFEAL